MLHTSGAKSADGISGLHLVVVTYGIQRTPVVSLPQRGVRGASKRHDNDETSTAFDTCYDTRKAYHVSLSAPLTYTSTSSK